MNFNKKFVQKATDNLCCHNFNGIGYFARQCPSKKINQRTTNQATASRTAGRLQASTTVKNGVTKRKFSKGKVPPVSNFGTNTKKQHQCF